MREILFRGKAINRDKREYRTDYKNGDWVYGLLMKKYDDRFENLPAEMSNEYGVTGIEVDYKTIGEYTGLTDKNGNKIFEGDIIQGTFHGYKEVDVVRWSCTSGQFVFPIWDMNLYEVIGNIYDNPELLGVKNDRD